MKQLKMDIYLKKQTEYILLNKVYTHFLLRKALFYFITSCVIMLKHKKMEVIYEREKVRWFFRSHRTRRE